jgi:hypothetical protein
MDRKNVFVCVLGVALVLGFAGIASAQEDGTTEQVDWDDAAYYAELMDTFVNGHGVLMDTYYDEGQNVLWSQPASVKVEEAAAALAEGPDHAMALDTFQWVVPKLLWMCNYNAVDNPTCNIGTNYKWGATDFVLVTVTGNWAYFSTDSNLAACMKYHIERIRSSGTSAGYNYCSGEDDDYDGYVHDGSGTLILAEGATEEWCTSSMYNYYYYVDISDDLHLDDETYNNWNSIYAARFRYLVSGEYYRTVVSVMGCLE